MKWGHQKLWREQHPFFFPFRTGHFPLILSAPEDKVGNTLRSWREVSRKLFQGSRLGAVCARIIDRMETAYGVVSDSSSYQSLKKQKDKELEAWVKWFKLLP